MFALLIHLCGVFVLYSPFSLVFFFFFFFDVQHVLSMEPAFHHNNLVRRNVILMGDNLGDAKMAEGMEDIANIIKIGLLHDHVDLRLEQFKKEFDIVLLNDADMSFAQQLVEQVVAAAAVVTPAASSAAASQ